MHFDFFHTSICITNKGKQLVVSKEFLGQCELSVNIVLKGERERERERDERYSRVKELPKVCRTT